jgi:hypothetical protein
MTIFLSILSVFSSDTGRFAVYTIVIVALFLLIRIISRRNESTQDFSAPFSHGTANQISNPADSPPRFQVHEPMQFDKLELRKFHMREFDVLSGPPDPFEFVDELTAEIEVLSTGARSTFEFTVGTPSGFARLLENKGWESFYSPEIFVIRKYELEMVRQMIVEHISSLLENTRQSPSGDS